MSRFAEFISRFAEQKFRKKTHPKIPLKGIPQKDSEPSCCLIFGETAAWASSQFPESQFPEFLISMRKVVRTFSTRLRVFSVENDNILSPQGWWFRFAAPFGRTLPAAVGYVFFDELENKIRSKNVRKFGELTRVRIFGELTVSHDGYGTFRRLPFTWSKLISSNRRNEYFVDEMNMILDEMSED